MSGRSVKERAFRYSTAAKLANGLMSQNNYTSKGTPQRGVQTPTVRLAHGGKARSLAPSSASHHRERKCIERGSTCLRPADFSPRYVEQTIIGSLERSQEMRRSLVGHFAP